MEKPFDPDNPVANPRHFWGRDGDLTKIISRINAVRPQSISIVGGRKIGKTSIINMINLPEIQKRYLDNPENYIFLKMEVDETVADVHIFVQRMLDLMKANMKWCEIHLDESDDYTSIKKYITACSEKGMKVIVLLDDFHYITSNQAFPLEFFSFLRSMANSYNIAYVTSSRLELQKLCVIKDVEESPFFNIFSNFVLKLFTEQQVKNTVGEVLKQHSISTVGQEYFWRNAAYHPYIMCVVGSLLLDHDLAEVESKAMTQLGGFFSQLWDEMKDLEKEVLKTIIRDDQISQQAKYVVRELAKRSLLVEDNGSSEIFTPLFQKYVLDRHMQKGGWLKKLFCTS